MATPNRNESQRGAAGEPEEGSIFDDRDLFGPPKIQRGAQARQHEVQSQKA